MKKKLLGIAAGVIVFILSGCAMLQNLGVDQNAVAYQAGYVGTTQYLQNRDRLAPIITQGAEAAWKGFDAAVTFMKENPDAKPSTALQLIQQKIDESCPNATVAEEAKKVVTACWESFTSQVTVSDDKAAEFVRVMIALRDGIKAANETQR